MSARIDLSKLFPADANGVHAPLPKQQEFLSSVQDPSGPQYVAYYGGYGSGKSVVLCAAVIIQCVLHGGEWVMARHFMPELKRTTMKTFLELLPKELLIEHRIADAEVHIRSAKGKAIVYFVGLDEPGKLDSLNLSGFAIDEASQVPEEAFLKLQGRLRNPKGLRKGLLCGNPKGRDWVYRYFVSKQALKGTEKMPLEQVQAKYRMIVAPSTENKHLPDGYIESMLGTYSKERIQRDIMGSFDSFEGMVYTEFDRSVHVIKPFEIPKEWTRIVGADHGYRNPACWLWAAVDYDGNIYVYREFYRSEWIIEQICKGHKEKRQPGVVALNGTDKLSGIYLDPSTRAAKGQTGISDWAAYMEHLPTKFPLLPAANDVEAGIDRVKQYLKLDEKTKKPALYIFDNCTNLLDEIGEYRYMELTASQQGKVNEKEAPRKYKDHAMDALRYLVMSRPERAKRSELPDRFYPGLNVKKDWIRIRKPKISDPFSDS